LQPKPFSGLYVTLCQPLLIGDVTAGPLFLLYWPRANPYQS